MPINLRTTFRRGPHVEALLDGRVTSDWLHLQFIPVEPISRAFRRAIRDNEFDVTEMALVTLAMALDAGYPWVGLPVVVLRGFHHAALRTPVDSPVRSPQDLAGRKVGVRAYSQTTGVWVRGILDREYGVSPDRMVWLTTEDAHVAGFSDPQYVQRAPNGISLPDLIRSGEVAAAIGDGSTSFPDSRSVIPDAAAAAAEWQRRTGIIPVNHVIAFRKELLDQEPSIDAELLRMFRLARDLWQSEEDGLVFDREAHAASIDLGLRFAFDQGLTRKLYCYDDLFRQSPRFSKTRISGTENRPADT